MEDLIIRRRNTLRHHYTQTSNVLLFGYRQLSDGAKLTYQVIDSFDWADGVGLRKGFAHPSLGRLASIRGVEKRSVRRHLAELEKVRLITRKERPGRPNLLIIEDPSPEGAEAYRKTFGGVGEDKNVRPTQDKNVRPYKKEEERREEKQILVNERIRPSRDGGRGGSYEHIAHTIRGIQATRNSTPNRSEPNKAKREYLAQEMLGVLKDEHSLGYYRRLAEEVQPRRIFEALSIVKQLSRECRVTKSRGAAFVSLIKERSKRVAKSGRR